MNLMECAYCARPFELGPPYLAGSLVLPCVNAKRVHAAVVRLHAGCSQRWLEWYRSSALSRLSDLVSETPARICLQGTQSVVAERCLRAHRVVPDSRCANCGVYAQEHCVFRPCEACYRVQYCDFLCQQRHWAGGHSRECESNSENSVAF